MRKIDFLSEFPRVFIFQEEIYKTNLGGVLFLIYIIIMIIISTTYILDFVINDKYEIEYISNNRNNTLFEDLDAINNNTDFNPLMEFTLFVPKEYYSENIKILLDRNGNPQLKNFSEIFIYQNKTTGKLVESMAFNIKSKVTNFQIDVVYYCADNPDFCYPYDHRPIVLGFSTLFPKIDLQNSVKPVLNEEKESDIYIFDLKFTEQFIENYNWKVIKYKEKKGLSRIFDKLLDLKSEYFTGYYDSLYEYEDDEWDIYIDGSSYKYLRTIRIENLHEEYDEYRRKKRTELDVLSTISALFTPIRLVFLIIYRFYAKKFNNYKIIENILNQKSKPKKLIELKNISEIKDTSIKDLNDNEKQEILIKSEIEEKPDDNTEENNEEKKDSNENKSDKDTKGIILPKYFFGQFFLNNIYCQCCKRRKCLKEFNKYHQQDILEICNTINMKYLSLNSLLYNQIMIENLMKDYNWNNSSLNNIKNNELILKLQTLIE